MLARSLTPSYRQSCASRHAVRGSRGLSFEEVLASWSSPSAQHPSTFIVCTIYWENMVSCVKRRQKWHGHGLPSWNLVLVNTTFWGSHPRLSAPKVVENAEYGRSMLLALSRSNRILMCERPHALANSNQFINAPLDQTRYPDVLASPDSCRVALPSK